MLALDFDVDVDPLFTPGQRGDLNEAVDQALAEFSIPYHLGEFLVEKNVRLLLVDFGMGQREVEGHELGEVARQRVLPERVVVVAWCGLGCHRLNLAESGRTFRVMMIDG